MIVPGNRALERNDDLSERAHMQVSIIAEQQQNHVHPNPNSVPQPRLIVRFYEP